MTRLEALRELQATVEAGNVIQAVDASTLWPDVRIWGSICKASQDDLNAARDAHENLIPHWDIKTFSLAGEVVLRRGRPVNTVYGYSTNGVAVAWLLAIIAALIAEEDQ